MRTVRLSRSPARFRCSTSARACAVVCAQELIRVNSRDYFRASQLREESLSKYLRPGQPEAGEGKPAHGRHNTVVHLRSLLRINSSEILKEFTAGIHIRTVLSCAIASCSERESSISPEAIPAESMSSQSFIYV